MEPLLSSIDSDSFELFVFNHWDKEETAHIFTGYSYYSVHGSKQLCFLLEEDARKGRELLSADIRLAHQVEAETLVLHSYNSLNKTPDLHRVVTTLMEVNPSARDHGVALSLELIPHISLLIPDLAFYLDTHLDSSFSLTMDLEYTSKFDCLREVLQYSPRINNVHVRDYDGEWVVDGRRKYLKPLDGNLDFDSIFSEILQAGYVSTFTLEAPHASVDEINVSMTWLRTSLKTHRFPSSPPVSSNHPGRRP
ncbi:MAG: sugar phosphate isomerase/epimerase [Theionarchaea archaeon]|nr:sugar phosphate isomerase/epimerase [Theionarchaea archaeon]